MAGRVCNRVHRNWARAILLILPLMYLTFFSVAFAETKPESHSISEQKAAIATKPHQRKMHANNDLPKSLLKVLKKYKIPQKNISIYVRDLNSNNVLLNHNIHKLRNPASTMKLFTTFAALKELGPNYSWRTEVWLRGELKSDVLEGDLLIKGYGDPFLVHENYWKLVNSLREKGIKKINGNIIIDNSYFELSKHDPSRFDGKSFRVYNAQPSALMFNFQATRFLFKPSITENKKGVSGQVEIKAYPHLSEQTLSNKVKLRKGRCKKAYLRPKFTRKKEGVLEVQGNYSERCKQRYILRSVSNHTQHAYNAFREFWYGLGGEINGGLKEGQVTSSDELFDIYSSPTLGEQIRLMNKWSNNVMTRQLLLTLGAKRYGIPGTVEKGRKALLEILRENDINTKGMVIDNGSGLSRNIKVNTEQMAQLLDTAFRDVYMPEFISSLAISGVDGTLVKRFKKDDLRSRGHFKTGTLDYVKAMAGYMLSRNGKRLAIVILHNGKRAGAGRGRQLQDALLRWSFEQ